MGKFISKIVSPEEQLGNGRVKPGKVAWVPVNDAAKVTPLAESALQSGHWVPENPNEIELARKRINEAEEKARNRRGQ